MREVGQKQTLQIKFSLQTQFLSSKRNPKMIETHGNVLKPVSDPSQNQTDVASQMWTNQNANPP